MQPTPLQKLPHVLVDGLTTALQALPQTAFIVLLVFTIKFLPLEYVMACEQQISPHVLGVAQEKFHCPPYHVRPPTTTLDLASLLSAIGFQAPP